jgi:hypothetical protein
MVMDGMSKMNGDGWNEQDEWGCGWNGDGLLYQIYAYTQRMNLVVELALCALRFT